MLIRSIGSIWTATHKLMAPSTCRHRLVAGSTSCVERAGDMARETPAGDQDHVKADMLCAIVRIEAAILCRGDDPLLLPRRNCLSGVVVARSGP